MQALTDLLRRLIREKRANPTNDLLGNLATAGPLSEDELAGLGVLLLTAGHETIANMLGLGTFVLLSNPDKIAQLRADPGLMKNAVEELLRYLTIFHFGVFRTPLQDVELAGHLIKSGESVTVSLPAANRDPSRFGEPDKLDFDRVSNRHLAFGYGIHQCTGQHLARGEMQCGYAALLREFPTLRLAAPPSEIPLCTDPARYGVHRLPVVWESAWSAGQLVVSRTVRSIHAGQGRFRRVRLLRPVRAHGPGSVRSRRGRRRRRAAATPAVGPGARRGTGGGDAVPGSGHFIGVNRRSCGRLAGCGQDRAQPKIQARAERPSKDTPIIISIFRERDYRTSEFSSRCRPGLRAFPPDRKRPGPFQCPGSRPRAGCIWLSFPQPQVNFREPRAFYQDPAT